MALVFSTRVVGWNCGCMTVNYVGPLTDMPSHSAFKSGDDYRKVHLEFECSSPSELRRMKESIEIRFVQDEQPRTGGKATRSVHVGPRSVS